MARSGTSAAPRGQNPNPSNPQQGKIAEVPEPAVPFKAYGLRKGPDGLQVCEVEVHTDGSSTVRQVRQGEPQRAIAFAYLEAQVERAYMEG